VKSTPGWRTNPKIKIFDRKFGTRPEIRQEGNLRPLFPKKFPYMFADEQSIEFQQAAIRSDSGIKTGAIDF